MHAILPKSLALVVLATIPLVFVLMVMALPLIRLMNGGRPEYAMRGVWGMSWEVMRSFAVGCIGVLADPW